MNRVRSLTVVIPVFNEAPNLQPLFSELCTQLDLLQRDWQVLFVDDASTDDSLQIMKDLAGKDSRVGYLSFARNCGQSAAFAAGFRAAAGEIVITMDADLQNDPADIPHMLETFEQGCDMVIGWRTRRRDTWSKRLASRLANGIRNALTRETVHDTGCSLKILRTDMARHLPMFVGMHRFLPTLMKMAGATVQEVPVNHRPRIHGVSKYSAFGRAKTTFFDLLAVMWMQRRNIRYRIREAHVPEKR